MIIENHLLTSIENKFSTAFKLNKKAIASGACNYNPHLAVRKKHEEVGLHSNFLYSLLNPQGDHFRGSYFLYSFLRAINAVDDSEETIKKLAGAKVTREKHKIDLLIEAEDHWYIIENKIYAADQPSQIARYIYRIEKIEKSTKNDFIKAGKAYKPRGISVIYLTLSGYKPSKKSLSPCKADGEKVNGWCIAENSPDCNIPLLLISYKKIRAWCDECLVQNHVTNSPALYYSIASYKQVLDRLLGEAAAGIPPLGGQCFPITTNEDFFLSLTDDEKKAFINAANTSTSSPDNRIPEFLNTSLIENKKIKNPKMLLQSIFNGILHRFRDGVYSEAAMHGFVIANARDGFKLNDVKLLETPINWYTKNKQRTGRHQFMAFKPRAAEDGFWYVIYFAHYAFYHGFIKTEGNILQEIDAKDLLLRHGKKCELLSRMESYKYSPNGKLYVDLLGTAHYDDNDKFFAENNKAMDYLLRPKELYEKVMKPTINAFWGKQDEGDDSTTKKLFLKAIE
jgi:hypothetical protein